MKTFELEAPLRASRVLQKKSMFPIAKWLQTEFGKQQGALKNCEARAHKEYTGSVAVQILNFSKASHPTLIDVSAKAPPIRSSTWHPTQLPTCQLDLSLYTYIPLVFWPHTLCGGVVMAMAAAEATATATASL